MAVGKKAYVKRKGKISIKEAIRVIHSANGLAFIAHPLAYKNFSLEKFIKYFIKNNGDGIETYYDYEYWKITANINTEVKKLKKIIKRYKLLETGGSDFHARQGQILGKLKVPYFIINKMKRARQ